jgi:hypothetical protein
VGPLRTLHPPFGLNVFIRMNSLFSGCHRHLVSPPDERKHLSFLCSKIWRRMCRQWPLTYASRGLFLLGRLSPTICWRSFMRRQTATSQTQNNLSSKHTSCCQNHRLYSHSLLFLLREGWSNPRDCRTSVDHLVSSSRISQALGHPVPSRKMQQMRQWMRTIASTC